MNEGMSERGRDGDGPSLAPILNALRSRPDRPSIRKPQEVGDRPLIDERCKGDVAAAVDDVEICCKANVFLRERSIGI